MFEGGWICHQFARVSDARLPIQAGLFFTGSEGFPDRDTGVGRGAGETEDGTGGTGLQGGPEAGSGLEHHREFGNDGQRRAVGDEGCVAKNAVVTDFGGALGKKEAFFYAIAGNVGQQDAVRGGGLFHELPEFHAFVKSEQVAFAGASGNSVTGQRDVVPFFDVVLYLDLVDLAFVIERRRQRGEDSLKFHQFTMFSLDLDCTQETKDLLSFELWEYGCIGVVELSDSRLRVFFDDDSGEARTSEKFGGTAVRAKEIDWVAQSQEGFQPQNVGRKFFLVPQWRGDETPEGRFRIVVNNGLAFGTGRHETTRLCLALLEEYVRPGMTVVDIGTGSGILALGARLLGAARVIGCDIDPLAVEVAAETGVDVFIGSAPAIASGIADVVVANISPECLREMAGEWTRLLKPGGHAILSGVEAHDVLPISPIETRAEAEWRAYVIAQKPSQT